MNGFCVKIIILDIYIVIFYYKLVIGVGVAHITARAISLYCGELS